MFHFKVFLFHISLPVAALLLIFIAHDLSASACCVDQGSIVSTIAGNGTFGFSGEGGPAVSATFSLSSAIILDPTGNIYVSIDGRICKINLAGIITTVIGNGTYGLSGDGGPGLAAMVQYVECMKWHNNRLYFTDEANHEIRVYDPSTGIVDRICGNGTPTSTGDGGLATAATVMYPRGLDFDVAGNLYFADWMDNKIRKIDTAGMITTVAGTGVIGYAADGSPAISSPFSPGQLLVLPSGEIVFEDVLEYVVRKIDLAGKLQTLAGIHGSFGYSGDGGPASSAKITYINGMTLGCGGQLILAEGGSSDGYRIRVIDSAGMITTVAGTGVFTYNGDGMNAGVTNIQPLGVAIDDGGNLYVTSQTRIRKVSSGCTPSPTPTVSPSVTATPTQTATATETPTATISPTLTASETVTPSPTFSATFSCSPSFSVTPTFSMSPSASATPTITLTLTVTPTLTPTPLPLFLKLLPPSPNPAADEAWLPFHISSDADVDIDVFTVAGELVRRLGKVWTVAGVSERRWDLRNNADVKVASGIFIYRVRAVSARNEEKSDFSKCAVVR